MMEPKKSAPIRKIVIACIVAVILIGGAGVILGQQARQQEQAEREKRLNMNNDRIREEWAERQVNASEQETANLTEQSPQENPGVSSASDPAAKPQQPRPAAEPQVEKPAAKQTSFAKYARIKTWYSGGGFSSETAWVHFKAVDAQGNTIKEVPGSDEMNMRKEQSSMAKTPKRQELVNKLRQEMTSAGWTEIGVASDGEWYEYVFGKGKP